MVWQAHATNNFFFENDGGLLPNFYYISIEVT
jgi:hypothetical protein